MLSLNRVDGIFFFQHRKALEQFNPEILNMFSNTDKRTVTGFMLGFILLFFGFAERTLAEETTKETILQSIEEHRAEYSDLAQQIWKYAELGYQEEKSSKLLQEHLLRAGFSIDEGVAEIPTAFVASYGQGNPIIGILAEYDALPGLSQESVGLRKPVVQEGPGHACGHHLFGSGSISAAIAIRHWLERSEISGTIRLYGTPAEEGGSGKVYMVRAGLFDDVDAVLHWHPGDRNFAGPSSTNANKSAKFRFYGKPSHAAGAPEKGRSALDGVEAMNHMANLLREHVPEETRIHYVITKGGDAPNIVPELAEVFYYLRHPDTRRVEKLWRRLVATAEGAALGTGTKMDYEIIHGNYSVLPNETLSVIVDENLRQIGGFKYDAEEQRFALEIRETLTGMDLDLGSQEEVHPYVVEAKRGSTDVGDISWAVPTAGFNTATWVPGTGAHTWQAVAAGGMSIGHKGMMVAAKTLALTAVDLYLAPSVIEKAKEELDKKRGEDFNYRPLLGDRSPPLDYRK